MAGSAPQGWYPAAGGSTGLRWWNGTSWTDYTAVPGSVLDRGSFEASRTRGQAWYSLTDPAGTTLGDAYEVQTGPQQLVPVPMEAGRWAEPPAAFASLEAVIRDTRQAHLLSAVRLAPEPVVTVYGPDRTTLGTISHTAEASRPGIDVTLGSALAYRIVSPDRGERPRGASRFGIQRADGAEVGSLTLRRVVDRQPGGPTPGLRFVLAISVTEPQRPPASGLVGALPVALTMLVAPALGMDLGASLPNLSGLGRRALGGLAGALLEGLADTDWS
jgi:hypothetical protein